MVSLLGAVRDLDRLRQIYVVLVRHGFGELAQRLGFGKRGKAAGGAGGDTAAGNTTAVAKSKAFPRCTACPLPNYSVKRLRSSLAYAPRTGPNLSLFRH